MSRERRPPNSRGCAGCLVLAIPAVLWLLNVIAEDVAQDYYWPVVETLWSIGGLTVAGWLLAIGLFLALGHSSTEYKTKLTHSQESRDRALALIEVYNLVLRSADNLSDSAEGENRKHELTEAILVGAATVFATTTTRASVYLLRDDQLEMYASYQMPTNYPREFHVGRNDPSRKPGVAGRAFISKETQVAHFTLSEDGTSWECDHADYFWHGDPKRVPQYKTFIASPISSETGYTVGVLCLDSPDAEVFDNDSTRRLVESIGSLIALTIDLADRFQQRQLDDA